MISTSPARLRALALSSTLTLLVLLACEGRALADLPPPPLSRITEGPWFLLVLALAAQLTVADLYRRRRKLGQRVLAWSAVGIVASVPLVFFALAFADDLVSGAPMAAAGAFVVEGAVLLLACRRDLGVRSAALLALLMSLSGLIVGAGLVLAFFPLEYSRSYRPFREAPPTLSRPINQPDPAAK